MSLPPAEKALSKACKTMAQVVKRQVPWPGATRGEASDPYESLFRAIVYQQLSGKAAATILARTVALFPDDPFPPPHAMLGADPEVLRGARACRARSRPR